MKYGKLTLGQQIDALIKTLGGMDIVQKILSGAAIVTITVPEILQLITTTSVEAMDRFVAADHFRARQTTDGVKICDIGRNFHSYFLQKVENDIEATNLRIHALTENSTDQPILATLGDVREIELGYLWQLLRRQGNGERGDLRTTRGSNISYIRDRKGVLRCVIATCDPGNSWSFDAFSPGSAIAWIGNGTHVVSR